MSVAEDLGYTHRGANAAQRAVQVFGSTRVGAWLFSKILAPTDRLIHRMTKGRTSGPAVLAGLPVMMVTATGRTSGLPRTTPLIAVPIDDSLALIGTSFGQPRTPAWVFNLEADPRVAVAYRDRHCELRARPATDAERASVWDAASGLYGGYDKYQTRITDRDIRIFVFEPTIPA